MKERTEGRMWQGEGEEIEIKKNAAMENFSITRTRGRREGRRKRRMRDGHEEEEVAVKEILSLHERFSSPCAHVRERDNIFF